jgi:membrane protease YdiL (CAAX protease family)
MNLGGNNASSRKPRLIYKLGTVLPWLLVSPIALLLAIPVLLLPSAAGVPWWLAIALNAFNEEMTYRASLLAGLEPALGPWQALWNTALFFGLGHYFGVPYGVVGVLMATFLGWILGKAMLETRGFFWAWLIHFVQDGLIFSFMAAGSITPGGLAFGLCTDVRFAWRRYHGL